MKKLAALAGMILVSTAFSQTWNTELGTLNLIGCYGNQDGVYCDFNYTLTKKQTASIKFDTSNFKIFKQDGTSQESDGVTLIDGKFGNRYAGSSTKEIIAGVPVKVQTYFNTPSSARSFKALAFNDQKFDNIPIRPYGTVSTTPAQLPVTSPVKGFTISLSNCQLQGPDYVCTATLTPTK